MYQRGRWFGSFKPIKYGADCIVIHFAYGAFASLLPDRMVGCPLLYNRGNLKARGIYLMLEATRPLSVRAVFFYQQRKRDMQNNSITVADLFAGIGGIALGLKRAGFNILWANEMDHNACKTYATNFKHKLYECEIQKLNPDNLPKVDLIAGGFPCQAFSVAGYRKGFNDTRGTLFFEIMRLVDKIQPEYLFLENVKNLERHDKGNTFKTLLHELEKRGYYVKHKVLNTCEYSDIPQNRERIYIVCFKSKAIYDAFEFPKKIKKSKPICKLLDTDVDARFYYDSTTPFFPILQTEMKNPCTVYQWRRVYLRENKNNICPTLTANMGMGGHNVPLVVDHKGIRKLTPRECARFQGFPENYKLPNIANSALYKQFGNSVSVPVIEAVAKEIIKAIKKAS